MQAPLVERNQPRSAACGLTPRARGVRVPVRYGAHRAPRPSTGMEYALAVMRRETRQRSGLALNRYPAFVEARPVRRGSVGHS
jgi:hypothetical protein